MIERTNYLLLRLDHFAEESTAGSARLEILYMKRDKQRLYYDGLC